MRRKTTTGWNWIDRAKNRFESGGCCHAPINRRIHLRRINLFSLDSLFSRPTNIFMMLFSHFAPSAILMQVEWLSQRMCVCVQCMPKAWSISLWMCHINARKKKCTLFIRPKTTIWWLHIIYFTSMMTRTMTKPCWWPLFIYWQIIDMRPFHTTYQKPNHNISTIHSIYSEFVTNVQNIS